MRIGFKPRAGLQDGLRQRQVEKKQVIAISENKATQRHGSNDDGSPKAYKGYVSGSNFCLEVTCSPKGKWQGIVISTYEAYQFMRQYPGEQRGEGLRRLRAACSLRDGRPLIMRLHRGDLVRMTVEGEIGVWRVVKMRADDGRLYLARHHEANVDARDRSKEDSFSYMAKNASSMQQAGARKVTVSPIGELTVHRPRRD